MSNQFGAKDMLALLDALKNAMRDFAAREEKLNADFRARSTVETRAFDAAKEKQTAEAGETTAKAEVGYQEAKTRAKARFEARKAKINSAHIAARKRVLDEIGRQEADIKYSVQSGSLEAERVRDEKLAASSTALQDFNQRTTEMANRLGELEVSAQKAFGGYGKFKKLLAPEREWPQPDLSGDENQLLDELQRLEKKTGDDIGRFRGLFPASIFRALPIWLWGILLLGFAAVAPLLPQMGVKNVPIMYAGISAGVFVLALIAYIVGGQQGSAPAKEIAGEIVRARWLINACFEKAKTHTQQDQVKLRNETADSIAAMNQRWKQSVKDAIEARGTRPARVDEKAQKAFKKNDELFAIKTRRLDRGHTEAMTKLRASLDAEAKEIAETHRAKISRLETEFAGLWSAMEVEWKAIVEPIYKSIREANEFAAKLFPPWEIPRWKDWEPPLEFQNAAKFGTLDVDITKAAELVPKDKRLALPGPANFSIPLLLTYPLQGSILFEASKSGHEEAIAAINNIIFRLLSTNPAGKLSFTIFDPVGLGQNFAGLMHLADFEESHINSRIWTQSAQFEEKLGELNEHMEKVIQMYLRNEYETIAEYNAQAGTIAEKYHILVIASFPVNFSDTAAKRLRNIATSGARCGVYTLIHWDQRNALPQDFVPDELRKNSVTLARRENDFVLANWRAAGSQVLLDPAPSAEFATHFLREVGQKGKDSNRVEVPFEQIAPKNGEIWSEETSEELRVPIGRSGATKLQYLEIGKATRQHALIAGKTGSGKSTLFHVMITNLSLWCSPEQVEFYLVDFKKGVEFKCYASRHLPHAKVVAIESDRQFGLSVLERIDAELRRRGDLFRQMGVQDLAGYKRAGGTEAMPRSLLMIDEFQEFFVEEDHVSQSAAVLLDRIVRQGRAFGIHVLLGSQTLGGAYTLARATLGQMVIRIALQTNEADAYLIMDQDNPAPRLLSRPGEGIYNDSAGAIEGNSPFQAVWLPEEVRDRYLAEVRELADKSGKKFPGPFVFEGNAPADVAENVTLRALLDAKTVKAPAQARAWLGAPNSIKGPTEAVFLKQSGNNLLIVGQNAESSLTMLAVVLVSLSAQYPKGGVRFVLLDSTGPESPEREFLDRVVGTVPHDITRVKGGDVAGAMNELAEELKKRNEDEQNAGPEIFVLIQDLQNYKKLRQEDEFSFSSTDAASPASILLSLISDGPAHGIHVVATCDTYTNVNRFLGRKNLTEFEMRVLFQMSASDSASLVDSPDASTLGMHRALYYNDREGYTEMFRPYARPGNEWIEQAGAGLKQLIQ
ncbi:MAG TPA: FtsK/SpoIIIE domain-containing protein, partial [Candidatus Polarisedimenticolia bacterium]|nr:FtsK/SpoIIIE domain-containing protein [Candidatus Polarisedimenticolia bacterium]